MLRDDEDPGDEFVPDITTASRSGDVVSGVALMRSGWRTGDGEDFCRDFQMPQSFRTVMDTDAYDDEEARILNAAWCDKMNLWFDKHARSPLTAASIRTGMARYVEPQEFTELEATASPAVFARMVQIRQLRPRVAASRALAVPTPAASARASCSARSSTDGGPFRILP